MDQNLKRFSKIIRYNFLAHTAVYFSLDSQEKANYITSFFVKWQMKVQRGAKIISFYGVLKN